MYYKYLRFLHKIDLFYILIEGIDIEIVKQEQIIHFPKVTAFYMAYTTWWYCKHIWVYGQIFTS